MPFSDTTKDYFYKKKVIILQRKKGYRFSVDAPILADFLPSCPSEEALEIGTGCGIISMLVLYKKKFSKIYAVEIQESLSHLAVKNAEKNRFSQKFQVIQGDFNKNYNHFSGFGLRYIFSNPPYFQVLQGRLSPNPEIRAAKAETALTLKELLVKSRAILGKKGSLFLVLPYDRFDELLKISKITGFFTRRIRNIFSFKNGKPERFLVQLTTHDMSTEKMEPLVIFKEKGIYTKEMDKILTG
jgi:tRNA1(Val) A37 N6-methylase TrmN6